ncbi:hypothetical protein HD806DRAFT_531414 [Xylariaceae sp. AK1471]|nr:hypothetical protein HD806DRAFT_531414 [Xylariaceae sp. AK1471]
MSLVNFPKFAQLSQELQDLIWNFAMGEQGQFKEMSAVKGSGKPQAMMKVYISSAKSFKISLPKVAQVCRAARDQALRMSVICIPDDYLADIRTRPLLLKELQNVYTVALNLNAFSPDVAKVPMIVMSLLERLAFFPAVKTVYVIVEQFETSFAPVDGIDWLWGVVIPWYFVIVVDEMANVRGEQAQDKRPRRFGNLEEWDFCIQEIKLELSRRRMTIRPTPEIIPAVSFEAGIRNEFYDTNQEEGII